jgi:hypothetical protein
VHKLSEAPASDGANSWAANPINAPVDAGLDDAVNQRLTYEMLAEQEEEVSGPVSATPVQSQRN